MNVTVIGAGYVGLVTAACLAESGNRVTCVDVDDEKIAGLRHGDLPIHEPGLTTLIKHNLAIGSLHFAIDAELAIARSDVVFIAVGTPAGSDGGVDLSQVDAVAQIIGMHMTHYTVVANKSTVPVGSTGYVRAIVQQMLDQRGATILFDVVSNPEFLKEGTAVDDFMRPARTIIGSTSNRAINIMRELYAPFNHNHDRFLVMEEKSAELTKYAANAMLATKISFMNEMAAIAEKVGANIEQVRQGIGSDPRIGYHFIYAGAGYGGSCFPKDIKALAATAKAQGCSVPLLNAVETVNQRQKHKLHQMVSTYFNGNLTGKTFALWGLAFKPKTDDMREAPSRYLMESLWRDGAKVQAYDPEAQLTAQQLYGQRDDLVLCKTPYDALKHADALIIVTEWKLFRSPDFQQIRQTLAHPVIFDGRNLYKPEQVEQQGLAYYGVGLGRSLTQPIS